MYQLQKESTRLVPANNTIYTKLLMDSYFTRKVDLVVEGIR